MEDLIFDSFVDLLYIYLFYIIMILDWLIECVRSAAYQYIPLVTSNHYDLKASKSFGLLRRTKHFGFKYDRGHIAREFAHPTTIPIPELPKSLHAKAFR